MSLSQNEADLASVSCLDDPVRGRLYAFVSGRDEPVGRDEAAAAVGIGRALAVYHLDKLVESGLLTASYRRPPGRSGPGAGRPAKVYARSGGEFIVTVPPREYELAARLLGQAVAADRTGCARATLHDAAWRLGADLGRRYRTDDPRGGGQRLALDRVLAEHGFEPWRDGHGTIRMRNCPFHRLADLQPDVVCHMNLALIQGLVAGLGADGLDPVPAPEPGHCCVTIPESHERNNMTHRPILGRTDQAPSLPTPSSANGTQPRPAPLEAADAERPDTERLDAEPNHGQYPADLDAAERPVDLVTAERAAADFLTALGIDVNREEQRATPARMARAYAELLAAQPFQLTTFPNDEGYDELVLARAIPFRTLCEHHMLLFSGVAHVGYLPGERILGLSKLARLVAHFAARPQTQERLTMQIAKCLDTNLSPRGVGVVLEAEHTCMTQRGIRALGSTTVTSALLGTLRADPRSRAEFFALARVPTSPGPM